MTQTDGRPEETLRASSVSRSYEGVQALQDVSLELHRKEVVGLIGPNGAGKSTLVNLLTGFDFPSSGTVELGGRDITRWSSHRRARAGVARSFQHSRSFEACRCVRTSRCRLSGSERARVRRGGARTSCSSSSA